jgi:hypothetical protein
MLRYAWRWGVTPAPPIEIALVKEVKPVVEFYDLEEYERLVSGASAACPESHLLVLLGGEAGLALVK